MLRVVAGGARALLGLRAGRKVWRARSERTYIGSGPSTRVYLVLTNPPMSGRRLFVFAGFAVKKRADERTRTALLLITSALLSCRSYLPAPVPSSPYFREAHNVRNQRPVMVRNVWRCSKTFSFDAPSTRRPASTPPSSLRPRRWRQRGVKKGRNRVNPPRSANVLPAKHRFFRVGDAGFEPATSSL